MTMKLHYVTYRVRGETDAIKRWFATFEEAEALRDKVTKGFTPEDFSQVPTHTEENVPTTQRELARWLDVKFGT
jgi:hypothetical protein